MVLVIKLKKPTIKDVAEAAGVSTATVSFVLNNNRFQSISDATCKKVTAAAEKLGYTPSAIAQGLKSRLSKTIAVVSYFSLTEGHFNEVLLGIYGACEKSGYAVIISSVNNPYEYAELYRNNRIDGVVIICPYDIGIDFDEQENERIIRQLGIPAVFINSTKDAEQVENGNIRYIKFDYFSCGYSAASALVDAGHRNIYYIEPDDDDYDKIPVQSSEIFKGFTACMEFNDITPAKNRTVCVSELEKMLDDKMCNAFVANNLACAAKLYRMCADRNLRIGEDISVVCATYSSGAEYLYPEIVCARLPFYTIGTLGAHDVLDLIKGRFSADGYLMPCSVTSGKSVFLKES